MLITLYLSVKTFISTMCMVQSWILLKMTADLNGPSFSSLGSLECLQCLFQCVGVSDEGLNIHTARGHHLKGSRVAGNKGIELYYTHRPQLLPTSWHIERCHECLPLSQKHQRWGSWLQELQNQQEQGLHQNKLPGIDRESLALSH